jgi:hypothetical protein
LGLYGLWHGAKQWKDRSIDLGFLVSNDGVHFREPARDWVFLQRGEDGAWDEGGLLQAQAFENVGEATYVWYGAWDLRVWDPRARAFRRVAAWDWPRCRGTGSPFCLPRAKSPRPS